MMKKNYIAFILLCLFNFPSMSQNETALILDETYEQFRETRLKQRRFKHEQITSLINDAGQSAFFELTRVGESVEGRQISMLQYGNGPVKILLWSQMHGDESTATMALFDIFKFLQDDQVLSEQKELLNNRTTIYFIPMLNPDGAERFQRRNAQGIDINRDAVRLQTNEGKILQAVHDRTGANVGFNLHDQSRYYNVEGSSKPATISVLAPAFNEDKDINDVRKRAMQIIVRMNRTLQQFAPGHVGRYSDDFEPRAFGDNIQKWGTSTILIESGGYYADREKQFIRKLNYIAILDALFAIADNSFAEEDMNRYEMIPRHDQKMFDLKISGIEIPMDNGSYVADLGIDLYENDQADHSTYYFKGQLEDVGDLSTHYGYESLNAEGLVFEMARIYDDGDRNISREDQIQLLREGYGYLRVGEKADQPDQDLLLNTVSASFKVPGEVAPGKPANFFLKEGEKYRYAVINGFLIDLADPEPEQSFNSLFFNE